MNERSQAQVGMAVFLASWAMLVAALCFAALALRRHASFEPIGAVLGPELAALATAAVIASSVCLWRRRWRGALVLGAAFALCQIAIVSRAQALSEAAVLAPLSRDVLVLLVGFHVAHVGIGGVGLARSRGGAGWVAFWHALSLAWLLFVGVLWA